ncbi:T9SS type A sorting domain-containing protein [Patescibacteria group bacterium]|nr:T9SS type A sorting domain-containing protein [Patescibacteria group bacterium]
MKTIRITIAMLFLFVGSRIAFGQSSRTEQISLAAVSRIPVGFGGFNDFVFSVSPGPLGSWVIGGLWAPDSNRAYYKAGVATVSQSGQTIWQDEWGADTVSASIQNQTVYDSTNHCIYQATFEGVMSAPVYIRKIDAINNKTIWQIQRENNASYFLRLWKGDLLAMRIGPNATVFLIDSANGAVQDSFQLGGFVSGKDMRVRGDSLWVFTNQFTAKYLLPSGQLLWQKSMSPFANPALSTYGTIDRDGCAYVATSYWFDPNRCLISFLALKYANNGDLLWSHRWFGWQDTTMASCQNLNNWVYGVAIDNSAKIFVVFGGVQQYGSSGQVDNRQSAYMAILSTKDGDTLSTSAWNDDQLPGALTYIWNGGFFNQTNQLVMLGLSATAGAVPQEPQENYLKIFNVDIIDAVTPGPVLPTSFQLSQNYPNPFNPTTTIEYSLPQRTNVNLTVYNVLGEKVTTLANGMEGPGQHQVIFDGSRFASGTYLYVLQTDQTRIVKKMMLVK